MYILKERQIDMCMYIYRGGETKLVNRSKSFIRVPNLYICTYTNIHRREKSFFTYIYL